MENSMPTPAFTFEVSLKEGDVLTPCGSFLEVSGLDAQADAVALQEGGENRFLHKLPGPAKHGRLVMKYSVMPVDSTLFEWAKDTLEGSLANPVEVKTVVVDLVDRKGTPKMRWVVESCWPALWKASKFEAMANTVTVEEIVFDYQTLTRKTV